MIIGGIDTCLVSAKICVYFHDICIIFIGVSLKGECLIWVISKSLKMKQINW